MNYHNITTDDMNNGSGLRVVLWLSGCNHYCKGCQNPQTWDANSGILFDDDAKSELFSYLNNEYISGLTLSGGDPLYTHNCKDVSKLIDEVKIWFPNKNIWIYTGYLFEEILNNEELKSIVSKCDVLVDGIFDQALFDITYPWAGSKNQRVINVKESINLNTMILWEA